jgi:cell division protease FtsH
MNSSIIHFSLFLSLSISTFGYNNFLKKYYNRFNSLRTNILNDENIENYENYWPLRKNFYEEYIKKLNSKNITIRDNAILNKGTTRKIYNLGKTKKDESNNELEEIEDDYERYLGEFKEKKVVNERESDIDNNEEVSQSKKRQIIIVSGKIKDLNIENGGLDFFETLEKLGEISDQEKSKIVQDNGDSDSAINNGWISSSNDDTQYEIVNNRIRSRRGGAKRETKSENFEVVKNMNITFNNVGGYESIKSELNQCIDILVNYKKYSKYNVRTPKGLILEGPPGNGKTLLAKAFAGESNTSFIAVSGSQFQEKYVGVGSNRIRELFDLAKKNIPCIIFIDEIDAVGRKRSTDGESSSSERDSTLNELLVQLDGFNTKNGIFLMGATNRADLLDPALLRPGRIDKRIFINLPDSKTREAILNIHLKGKPYDKSINITDLVDLTTGLSGAQIENLLNEAMLNALRLNHNHMVYKDIDTIINKIIAGWQPTEHQLTTDIIDKIAIHEMGHAIVGFLSKSHTKVSKVIINLSSPTSPGYTIFETSKSNIYTRESLFEHLMILLAGRIAEEVFYDTASTTTGAMDDLNKAFELAEKMIVHYGMGKKLIYPNLSNKYKEMIDDEVINLINEAYAISSFIIKNSKELIWECSEILKNNKLLKVDEINHLVNTKYPKVLDLQIKF